MTLRASIPSTDVERLELWRWHQLREQSLAGAGPVVMAKRVSAMAKVWSADAGKELLTLRCHAKSLPVIQL
jgi:hypothetical protein